MKSDAPRRSSFHQSAQLGSLRGFTSHQRFAGPIFFSVATQRVLPTSTARPPPLLGPTPGESLIPLLPKRGRVSGTWPPYKLLSSRRGARPRNLLQPVSRWPARGHFGRGTHFEDARLLLRVRS